VAQIQPFVLILMVAYGALAVGLVVALFVLLKQAKRAARVAEHTEQVVAQASSRLAETVKHQT
jgi:flagellar basal body-associated protein FliL